MEKKTYKQKDGRRISPTMSRMVHLVATQLGKALKRLEGEAIFERVEDLRQICKSAAMNDNPDLLQEAGKIIYSLSLKECHALIRSFSTYFHLVNKAEQIEISRINAEREQLSSKEAPRAESIREAIFRLKKNGVSFSQLSGIIANLDIQPTFTAHPTEARRRGILIKQGKIAGLLKSYLSASPAKQQEIAREILGHILILLATDEIRAERLTVEDEVNQGLYFVRNSLWEVLPTIYLELKSAVNEYYGQTMELPAFLKMRSWIGGDRDGNPFVTPEITWQTYLKHRQMALQWHLEDLRTLRRNLSISHKLAPASLALLKSLEKDLSEVALPENIVKYYRNEPYRLKLNVMMARLEALLADPTRRGYTPSKFTEDLTLIESSLRESGFQEIAESRLLQSVLLRSQIFGFNLLALDIRQHSRVHEQAVREIFRLAGINSDYLSLKEDRRTALLEQELSSRRPLLLPDAELSPATAEALELFRVLKRIRQIDPEAVGIYIVSMTHSLNHLLEVLLLAREAGLFIKENDHLCIPLDVVPLLETIDDLADGARLMERIFANPVYRRHLKFRADFQEIMLGYSDSNKDGGYWQANWSLFEAQKSLGETLQKQGINYRLFHGRGGTIGRGGGRANQAILAMPKPAQNGRIRFTEQGEIITYRYALTDIAHRHLEQIVNAMLLSQCPETEPVNARYSPTDVDFRLMARVARKSMETYRQLLQHPRFWDWYSTTTPIRFIGGLPMASRPVSRSRGGEMTFADLRAIPWVFSWTQIRAGVPGWFGIGEGLLEVLPEALQQLRKLYGNWPFFKAVVDNAQQEMARSRLIISRLYDHQPNSGFLKTIEEDFEKARSAILQITGQTELLDNRPVIQKSIQLRNPYTDVLNLLQAELLRRWAEDEESERDFLQYLILLSINAIAAAMQSTG
ncbi:MAG: phosphoenolpyruvate carboxylase [Calditrichia bacterium]